MQTQDINKMFKNALLDIFLNFFQVGDDKVVKQWDLTSDETEEPKTTYLHSNTMIGIFRFKFLMLFKNNIIFLFAGALDKQHSCLVFIS